MSLEVKRLTYPRVSAIIGKQTAEQMRKIPIDTLANAALRGTTVHSYCTAYAKGLYVPAIELEYEPYVDAFIDWYDANVEALVSSGDRLYDDELEYSGEYDLIVRLKGSELNVLIDIKTSSTVSKSWPIQLAAYENLLDINDLSCEAFYNVHLKKSKDSVKFKEIKYSQNEMKTSWKTFLSCLECYNYFDKKDSKDDE